MWAPDECKIFIPDALLHSPMPPTVITFFNFEPAGVVALCPATNLRPVAAESSPRWSELEAAPLNSVQLACQHRLQPGTGLHPAVGFRAAPAAVRARAPHGRHHRPEPDASVPSAPRRCHHWSSPSLPPPSAQASSTASHRRRPPLHRRWLFLNLAEFRVNFGLNLKV
jgi:hypothetical protein